MSAAAGVAHVARRYVPKAAHSWPRALPVLNVSIRNESSFSPFASLVSEGHGARRNIQLATSPVCQANAALRVNKDLMCFCKLRLKTIVLLSSCWRFCCEKAFVCCWRRAPKSCDLVMHDEKQARTSRDHDVASQIAHIFLFSSL